VEFLIVLVALCIVVLMVSSPLRRARMSERSGSEVADLEAAREAKYREIRDAELDYRTGKLSDEDYQAVDRALRAQAMEILRALDRARDN
jgi:Tfp pilus assembly protein PilX